MPLPPPAERKLLHTRRYHFTGHQRSDGLWDIDGHMTDAKSYSFPNAFRGSVEADEALHDMSIRLTIDEDFVVRDIVAVTDAGPYGICPEIAPNFARVAGLRLGRGWRQKIRQRLGGVEGCTHLVEMLGNMATVAFQTLHATLSEKAKGRPSRGKPPLIDSCHAYRSDGEIVERNWPDFHTGP